MPIENAQAATLILIPACCFIRTLPSRGLTIPYIEPSLPILFLNPIVKAPSYKYRCYLMSTCPIRLQCAHHRLE